MNSTPFKSGGDIYVQEYQGCLIYLNSLGQFYAQTGKRTPSSATLTGLRAKLRKLNPMPVIAVDALDLGYASDYDPPVPVTITQRLADGDVLVQYPDGVVVSRPLRRFVRRDAALEARMNEALSEYQEAAARYEKTKDAVQEIRHRFPFFIMVDILAAEQDAQPAVY